MNKRDFLKAAALSVATVVVQSGEAVGLNLSAAIPKNYVKLGKLTSFPQARAKLAVGTDRFGKKLSIWVIRNKNTASGFDAKCPHQGVVTKADGKGFICPAHNSMFTVSGTRVSGPAQTGLAKRKLAISAGMVYLVWN
jgi:cytochrome b6-f complex iron-sulfur subunit